VNIRHRHLGRRDQEVIRLVHPEEVLFEFRKLARPRHAGAVHHERRQHLRVAVLGGVQIQHEVDDRPFEQRTHPPVEREARPGDFRAAGEIEDAQVLADLPVRFGLEVEGRLFPPGPHDGVVRRARPADYGFVRQIRDREHQILQILFRLLQRIFQCLDPGRYLAHLCDDGGGIFLALLLFPDLLGYGIALAAQDLHLLEDGPSLLVETRENAEVDFLPSLQHLLPNEIEILPQKFDVQHGTALSLCNGFSRENPPITLNP